MKKLIKYGEVDSCRKLMHIQDLSKSLIAALEEADYEPFDEQSIEALVMLLKAMDQAIQLYYEQELGKKH